jgi:hypothetical protein
MAGNTDTLATKNTRHASNPLPFSLTDQQLQTVMLAAGSLSIEKRDVYLRRLAALLQFHGGRRHDDAAVATAVQLALAGLIQQSVA